MIDYPEQEAIAAVEKLVELLELYEEGDPVGRELADDALEPATSLLVRGRLLDMFISRAARQQTSS